MRALLAILALLPGVASAQATQPGQALPPSVQVQWLDPHVAQLAWAGGTGPGACVWRVRQYYQDYHQEPTCNVEAGTLFLGNDAYKGDIYQLRDRDGITVLATAQLGDPPRYVQRLPIIAMPAAGAAGMVVGAGRGVTARAHLRLHGANWPPRTE